MNLKTFGCMLLLAGLAVGCSSGRKTTPDWAATHGTMEPIAGMQKRLCCDERNWDKLRTGMTPRQVVALLGRPDHVKKYRSGASNWYYNPHHGVVYFDEDNRVVDWKKPDCIRGHKHCCDRPCCRG